MCLLAQEKDKQMKFKSKPIEEHLEVPLPDDGRWEEIVAHWARRDGSRATTNNENNLCYVVAVALRDELEPRGSLAELMSLVRTQGDAIVGHETHRVSKPNPRLLVGVGTAKDIGQRATECGADMLVIDAELSPSQTRNLEDATGFAVCDREAVILNVFQRHAKTQKARIQVEIAHLEYLRPRIRGIGLVMDQQAGGMVNSRGSGETASELLARRLDGRLAVLRKAFSKLAKSGTVQRQKRTTCKRIVLVGYTNAGKTSLMNTMTCAGLSAADRPFETLDTTSRCLTRHGGDVLVSDTVGFIRNLPDRLFASFESTLSETLEASLLALVVDASDPERELHLRTSEELLARLGADKIPRLYVFNKIDRLNLQPYQDSLDNLSRGHEHIAVCSHEAGDVARLKETLLRLARQEQQVCRVFLSYASTKAIATVYAKCRVISVKSTQDGLQFTIAGEPHVVAKIRSASEEIQQ